MVDIPEEAQISADVYGDQVVITIRDQQDEALEILICHDRLSAIDALEERIAGIDPGGLATLADELSQANSVPWQNGSSENFSVPTSLLPRLNELFAFGKAVCEQAGMGDPGEALQELLGDENIFYGYLSANDAAPDAEPVALVLFIDLRGATTGVVVQDQRQGPKLLDELTGIVGVKTFRELHTQLETILPANELPTLHFNQVTSAVLLVGRAAEVHLEKKRIARSTLQ